MCIELRMTAVVVKVDGVTGGVCVGVCFGCLGGCAEGALLHLRGDDVLMGGCDVVCSAVMGSVCFVCVKEAIVGCCFVGSQLYKDFATEEDVGGVGEVWVEAYVPL